MVFVVSVGIYVPIRLAMGRIYFPLGPDVLGEGSWFALVVFVTEFVCYFLVDNLFVCCVALWLGSLLFQPFDWLDWGITQRVMLLFFLCWRCAELRYLFVIICALVFRWGVCVFVPGPESFCQVLPSENLPLLKTSSVSLPAVVELRRALLATVGMEWLDSCGYGGTLWCCW